MKDEVTIPKLLQGPVDSDISIPYRWYLTEWHDGNEVVVEKVLARSWPEAEEIAASNGEVVVGFLLEELDRYGNPR